MSESSEDKTKRKFAAYLRQPIWTFQYTVFYSDMEDSKNLLKHQKVFRQKLARKFPDQTFLLRIQTLNRWGHQAYLTIYTTTETNGIYKLVEDYFHADVRVRHRRVSEAQCNNKARKILTQKPHDLAKWFGPVRIRRYGVINKALLADIEGEQ